MSMAPAKARGCDHGDPPCRSCINRRNRSRGLAKQRDVRKLLGIVAKFRGQHGNEEEWPESPRMPGVRWEVKSGIMPVFLRKAFQQLAATRARGAQWIPAVAVVPEGEQNAYVVMDLAQLLNYCEALSDVGQGRLIRDLVRDARRALDQIDQVAR